MRPDVNWRQHLEQLYRHIPVWGQNLGISLFGISYRRERLGGVFDSYVREFRARDRWSEHQMQNFLQERLRAVLMHAFLEVPYYSQKWAAAGVTIKDLEKLELTDLPRIPVTSKRDLVGSSNLFVAQDIAAKKKLRRYYTSGSTGTPIAFSCSSHDHQRFLAAREARSFGWAGTSILCPRAMIGGRMVVPDSKPPYYRYNLIERQVYFSAFHISPARVKDYLEGFHRYRPMVMTGYAHSYYTLARMMLEQGLRLNYTPTALILSSEKLTAEMKNVINDAFRARAYEEYGAVENCVLATECEAGRLHISPDFGIVEILDEHDIPVPDGHPGRIVCTGQLSETQPLIRYDLGDVGTISKSKCPCGRDHLPVLEEIVGRLEDAVLGRDGRETVRMHSLFIGLPHVLEGQVIQEQLDFIRVRVVAKSDFGNEEKQLIRRRLEERLGPIRVEVECVDNIERTHRGKFRSVISRLPLNPRGRVA